MENGTLTRTILHGRAGCLSCDLQGDIMSPERLAANALALLAVSAQPWLASISAGCWVSSQHIAPTTLWCCDCGECRIFHRYARRRRGSGRGFPRWQL